MNSLPFKKIIIGWDRIMDNYISYILSAYGIVFAVLGWLWYSTVKTWRVFLSSYTHGDDVNVAENRLNIKPKTDVKHK